LDIIRKKKETKRWGDAKREKSNLVYAQYSGKKNARRWRQRGLDLRDARKKTLQAL